MKIIKIGCRRIILCLCVVYLIKVNKLSFQTSTIIETRTMNTDIQPPEGKKCFSGIPEAHFIDDVDTYMKGNDSAEAKIKELDEVRGRRQKVYWL